MTPPVLTSVAGPLPESLLAARASLVARADSHDGVKPISDAALLHTSPAREHLLWWREGVGGDPVGAAALAGYALVDQASGDVELVVDPDVRGRGAGTELLAAALAAGGRRCWARPVAAAAEALADRFGLVPQRQLLLQTLTVASNDPAGESSIPAAWQVLPPGFILRRLNVEGSAADVRALLRVNAAAFTELPDQGGWTRADVEARMSAPWFRAEDVLLLVDSAAAAAAAGDEGAELPDGRLAGFHWTKVHPDGSGEVYVLAIDPAYQGRGLSRPLLAAGVDHLARGGCVEIGLFVDADNAAAVSLYRRLGFTTRRTDVQFAVSG